MNSIAIIPARGGSKGIPRKNIKLLGGKPLIAYNIEEALKAPSINRLVVSTDDDEIADISMSYGAEVVMRPKEISGDMATSESALVHVLNTLSEKEGYNPDLLVFLQCTSPLTSSEDMEGTIQTLIRENADTALTVTDFDYFLWGKDLNGEAIALNHDKTIRLNRQQRRGEQFLETGAVYVMRVKEFLEREFRFFGKTVFYVTPMERVLEIDEEIDFVKAEFIIRHNNDR
jgi:CMP-N-acetylneuraminic acid synthetase